jgi:hypothetical protein
LLSPTSQIRSDKPPNGKRISRREASAASEAVGWMRLLASALLFWNAPNNSSFQNVFK